MILEKTFYRTSEAAELLGVSQKSLYEWAAKGILVPHKTPGGHRRYSKELLEEYLSLACGPEMPQEATGFVRIKRNRQHDV